jgi:hypothetical protein
MNRGGDGMIVERREGAAASGGVGGEGAVAGGGCRE